MGLFKRKEKKAAAAAATAAPAAAAAAANPPATSRAAPSSAAAAARPDPAAAAARAAAQAERRKLAESAENVTKRILENKKMIEQQEKSLKHVDAQILVVMKEFKATQEAPVKDANKLRRLGVQLRQMQQKKQGIQRKIDDMTQYNHAMDQSASQKEDMENARRNVEVLRNEKVDVEEMERVYEEAAEHIRDADEVRQVQESHNLMGDVAFDMDDMANVVPDDIQQMMDLHEQDMAQKADAAVKAAEMTPSGMPAVPAAMTAAVASPARAAAPVGDDEAAFRQLEKQLAG